MIFFEIILSGHYCISWSLPQRHSGKETIHNAGAEGDVGSVPGSGWSSEVGNGNPLQYSCLENPMDRGVCNPLQKGYKELDMTEQLSTVFHESVTWYFFFTILENFCYYLFTYCFCSILYPSRTLITRTLDLFTVSHMFLMLFSVISQIFNLFLLVLQSGIFFLTYLLISLQLLIPSIGVLWSVEVTQSCPTLCDPMDCSPPDSSAHGILQARILEWVVCSFL